MVGKGTLLELDDVHESGGAKRIAHVVVFILVCLELQQISTLQAAQKVLRSLLIWYHFARSFLLQLTSAECVDLAFGTREWTPAMMKRFADEIGVIGSLGNCGNCMDLFGSCQHILSGIKKGCAKSSFDYFQPC